MIKITVAGERALDEIAAKQLGPDRGVQVPGNMLLTTPDALRTLIPGYERNDTIEERNLPARPLTPEARFDDDPYRQTHLQYPQLQASQILPEQYLVQGPARTLRNAGISGVAGGAVSTGVAGATIVGVSLAGGAPILESGLATLLYAPALIGAGVQGALLGAGVYGLGKVHNALWRKPGTPEVGGVGTLIRGLVSPITIPVGAIRALTRGKQV
jgi:hypothetical protein